MKKPLTLLILSAVTDLGAFAHDIGKVIVE